MQLLISINPKPGRTGKVNSEEASRLGREKQKSFSVMPSIFPNV
jgi:hypothetical protein